MPDMYNKSYYTLLSITLHFHISSIGKHYRNFIDPFFLLWFRMDLNLFLINLETEDGETKKSY